MRIIIAGGRDFRPSKTDWDWLDSLHATHQFTLVISGGARGADAFGEVWAKSKDLPVERHPANWQKHGRAAGPIRNAEMAAVADAVALFPGGAGTASMKREAEAKGLLIFERKSQP